MTPAAAWLVFAASLITLFVSKDAKKFRKWIAFLAVFALGIALYSTFWPATDTSKNGRSNVQQETHGEQSPAIQGVNGDVTIKNERDEHKGQK